MRTTAHAGFPWSRGGQLFLAVVPDHAAQAIRGAVMRRLIWHQAAAGLMCAVAVGCATTPRGDGALRSTASHAPTDRSVSESTVITQAELMRWAGLSLPDALRRARPAFFIPRPDARTRRDAPALVFLNDIYVGDLSALTSIPLETVREVRRLSRSELMMKFGRGDAAVGYLVKAK